MKRIALVAALVAAALVVSAPAYGQSATGDAYGSSGGEILGAVDSGGNDGGGSAGASAPSQVTKVSSSEGSLPFTGLDLGLLALGGIALVGVGFGLRRVARTQ